MIQVALRCVACNDILHTVQGKLGPTEQRQFHFVLRPMQNEKADPHWPQPVEIISMKPDTLTVGRNYVITIEPASGSEAEHIVQ